MPITFQGVQYDPSEPDSMWALARDLYLHDYDLGALNPGILADLAAKPECTVDDFMIAILSQAEGSPRLLTLPTDSAWRVEMRYDTTMWNEGFELAYEPRAVVYLADKAEATALANEIGQGRFDPRGEYIGYLGKVGEAHSGHPRYTLAQARTLLNAVREWDGI